MNVSLFNRRGSKRAREFDLLVREHLPALFSFLSRLTGCGADAEDILQDLLIKLYPRLNELKSLDEIRPWLMRVAYRQFIDYTRAQQRNPVSRHNSTELEHIPEDADLRTPESLLASQQHSVAVGKALDELDAERRALVVMHLMEGYTLEEVAVVLDQPLGTIKSRLHRLRAQLKLRFSLEPFSGRDRVVGKGDADAM